MQALRSPCVLSFSVRSSLKLKSLRLIITSESVRVGKGDLAVASRFELLSEKLKSLGYSFTSDSARFDGGCIAF